MYSSVVKDSQRIFFNFGWDGTSIPDIARALHRTAFPVNQNPQRAAQVLIRRFFAAGTEHASRPESDRSEQCGDVDCG